MVAGPHIPAATYRLQFSSTFTFRDAERLVPYLDALGVTHVYASPFLKVRAGSTHGYDITDYRALNHELGNESDLASLSAALRRHGMGLILDFVPNHMGIGLADNEWWLDVLEWGEASPFADFFDIDWRAPKSGLRGKVLLPVLGGPYGEVLEGGELKLVFDAGAGAFNVQYFGHVLPIRPGRYADIVAPWRARLAAGPVAERLEEVARRSRQVQLGHLSLRRRRLRREEGLAFKRWLAAAAAEAPDLRLALEEAAAALCGTPGRPRSFLGLHRLLERQAYRLAYWRVAATEINYRRFFDINDLAGVRMERRELFDTAHELIWRLVADGTLDGLRIDHIDGMLDPAQYCRRLAEGAAAARGATAAPARHRSSAPIYIVVEKILAAHESLRESWPIAGTTGYETLSLINGLFVRPDSVGPLRRTWRRFTGQREEFAAILYDARKHVLRHMLSSELEVLAIELDRLSERNWRSRDFTLGGLREVLEEVAACFPVYRTYVDERGASAEDRREIDVAIATARRRRGTGDDPVLDFVQAVLTADLARSGAPGYGRRAVTGFAMRFQQFSGPVMAKAMEDTAFYRHVPLLSLNEVGGDPRRFGLDPQDFHAAMLRRARRWPHAMNASGTHDTKRGEDARTRLDVLSELPGEWGQKVQRWSRLNRDLRGTAGDAPDRIDEYMLYQMLLGAWPATLMGDTPDGAQLGRFRERVEGAFIKSLREAKRRTSWMRPDAAYEAAATDFLRRLLDAAVSAAFIADCRGFARRVAWLGMLSSLAQVALKIGLPGVPDIYRGGELWDCSLVDPDNRGPVDFVARERMLATLFGECGSDAPLDADGWGTLLEHWQDGRVKMLVTAKLLRLRRRCRALFLDGDYRPLGPVGAEAAHVCAFARTFRGEAAIVAVARLLVPLGAGDGMPAAAAWRDTAIVLPPALAGRRYRDALTGRCWRPRRQRAGTSLPAAELFAVLPAAVLLREDIPAGGSGGRTRD